MHHETFGKRRNWLRGLAGRLPENVQTQKKKALNDMAELADIKDWFLWISEETLICESLLSECPPVEILSVHTLLKYRHFLWILLCRNVLCLILLCISKFLTIFTAASLLTLNLGTSLRVDISLNNLFKIISRTASPAATSSASVY